ncbi:hypothetical protein [Halococcus agarilyticus]|uniref:hypothetical protein n=1 Tax=Halococcus agarilyticus TaxID=1232219 RepID=UPI0006779976|nr:hypothetical protein [Halococcus agarilyticus]
MSEYEIHRPSFSGTTRNDWEFPSEVDFDTEDLPAAADRFLLSKSGFDEPGAFEDLALPVVTSRGELSYNALWAAKRGPYSVERIDGLDAETRQEVEELVDDLGHEHFGGFDDVTLPAARREIALSNDELDEDDEGIGGFVTAGHATPTPTRAAIGLLALVGASVAIDRLRR